MNAPQWALPGIGYKPGRICTRCGQLKQLEHFPKKKNGKQGKGTRCYTCLGRLDHQKIVYINEVSRGGRGVRLAIADSCAPMGTLFCSKCLTFKPECEFIRKGKSRPQCRDCAHRHRRAYEGTKKRRIKGTSRRRAFAQFAKKERVIVGRPKYHGWSPAEIYRHRYATEPQFQLAARMKRRIRKVLNQRGINKAGKSWRSFVGYTPKELWDHLIRQMPSGMTEEDLRSPRVHIDHIRPIAEFSFKSPEDPEFRSCFCLSNLRPVWADQNLRKGKRNEFLV